MYLFFAWYFEFFSHWYVFWTGLVKHLKSVCDSEGLRKAVEEVQPEVVKFGLRMGQSPQLYKVRTY